LRGGGEKVLLRGGGEKVLLRGGGEKVLLRGGGEKVRFRGGGEVTWLRCIGDVTWFRTCWNALTYPSRGYVSLCRCGVVTCTIGVRCSALSSCLHLTWFSRGDVTSRDVTSRVVTCGMKRLWWREVMLRRVSRDRVRNTVVLGFGNISKKISSLLQNIQVQGHSSEAQGKHQPKTVFTKIYKVVYKVV